jgi:hypothetical protein
MSCIGPLSISFWVIEACVDKLLQDPIAKAIEEKK